MRSALLPVVMTLLHALFTQSSLLAQSASAIEQKPWHAQKVRPVQGPAQDKNGNLLKWESQNNSSRHSEPRASCRGLKNTYISQPYINLYSLEQIPGMPDEYYRARGSFEGKCLTEAGYFENNRKAASVKVRTIPEFERFEFDLRVRAGRHPELRAYNINGERAAYPLQTGLQRIPLITNPAQAGAPAYIAPPTRGVDPKDPSLLFHPGKR